MSPMYGYQAKSSPRKEKEFVEVVFNDATDSGKKSEDEMMDTAIDNPVYQSDRDLSSQKKVIICKILKKCFSLPN